MFKKESYKFLCVQCDCWIYTDTQCVYFTCFVIPDLSIGVFPLDN